MPKATSAAITIDDAFAIREVIVKRQDFRNSAAREVCPVTAQEDGRLPRIQSTLTRYRD
jgi:hypothetical protein